MYTSMWCVVPLLSSTCSYASLERHMCLKFGRLPCLLIIPMGESQADVKVQIPKPNEKEGLGIGWPAQETDMEKLKALHADIKSKI